MRLKFYQLLLVENDTKPLRLELGEGYAGCSFAVNVKYDDGVEVVSGQLVDEANGYVDVLFEAGSLKPVESVRYEIQVTYPDGTIETINRAINPDDDEDEELLEFVIDEEIA